MSIEIKKRRETEWIIQFKNSPNKIIFKSIEESDRVISIEIGLSNDKNSLRIEISPVEFIKFYEIVKNFNSNIKQYYSEDDISEENRENADSSPHSSQEINRNEDFDGEYSVDTRDSGFHNIKEENNEEKEKDEPINNEWSDWN